jgi:regulatory protein
MPYRKTFTKEQALQKAKHYCAYQERSHFEAKEKLYSLGLHKQEVELVLSQLIEENYLNEERFAIRFASGKFRIKHWGRIKIKYELKQKQVSEYCIKTALKEIDEEEYRNALIKLASQKWTEVNKKTQSKYERISLTTDYLLQKGYESGLIREAIAEIKDQASLN